jgi:hypothetical protein
MAEGKFALWLIDVGDGKKPSQLMAEFYGPNDGKGGLCSSAGVKSRECDLDEFVVQANQL